PEKITDRREQLFNVIVLLDQLRDVAGSARGRDISERLSGLRIKPHARNVLRQHGDEGQPKALVEIRDELVARHLFELAVVVEALLKGQVPVHVVRIPPGILQALPEKPRLANAADFVTPRYDTFFAILAHEFAQRMDKFGLHVFEALVVGAQVGWRRFTVSVA